MIHVVGAVLIKDKCIILAKRASTLKNFPNLFEFPGGKIEKGETPKRALVRELYEELKIKVDVNNIEEFENNSHTHTIEKNGKIIHLTLFIVKKWKGKITIDPSVHSDLAYVEMKNLTSFKGMIPGDEVIIKDIIAVI
jgi:8-oxo-dGTP diphosphatase